MRAPLRLAVIEKSIMKTDIFVISCLFTYDVTQSVACTAGCRYRLTARDGVYYL